MNGTTQRLCVWSGPALIVLFLIGYVMAGLIPPPSPDNTAEQMVRFYAENSTWIRTGLVIGCVGSAMCYPWAAIIALQMQRIEGRSSPLALTELGSGLVLGLIFMYPMVLLGIAAYRPGETDPQITQLLTDMAWIGLIWVGPPTGVQALAIAIATLRDKRPTPVFPRWVGYFNIWCALLFIPGLACIYVKNGPLAYNGLISWWLVVITFTIWIAVMTPVMLRAITEQEKEEEEQADALPVLANN